MSSMVYDINELLEMKKQILLKKKTIAKEDTEAIKEALKEYMRIQKKIKYYSDEEYRKQKILKDIEYYFTNINSDYVKGLNTLNKIIEPESEDLHSGGIGIRKLTNMQISQQNIITRLITSLNTKPIYKLNSFGYEYIGHGLSSNIQTKLKNTFKSKNTIITHTDLKQYLNLHNIYYNI